MRGPLWTSCRGTGAATGAGILWKAGTGAGTVITGAAGTPYPASIGSALEQARRDPIRT